MYECEYEPHILIWVKSILEDNLPPQISREAVKHLREKYLQKEATPYMREPKTLLEDFIKDLDILLIQQQDGQ